MHATSIVNGVDLDRLSGTIDAVAANPALARFQFRARNHWIDGLLAVSASMVRFCVLLIRGRIHQPRQQLGHRLTFANGVSARVCHETIVDERRSDTPAVVVFKYRLWSQQSWVQKAYLRASGVLITPFLAGLPGFVSKLWLTYDEPAVYGGVYEWDGAQRAELAAQQYGGSSRALRCPVRLLTKSSRNQTRDEYLAESQAVVSPRSSEPATGDA